MCDDPVSRVSIANVSFASKAHHDLKQCDRTLVFDVGVSRLEQVALLGSTDEHEPCLTDRKSVV